MGRGSRKTRRSRPNRRNDLDRDDDFPMRGVEHNTNHVPKLNRRGRGGQYNSSNSSRNNTGHNRGDRPRKNRHAFSPLIDNPFQELSLDGPGFQDEQEPVLPRQRKRRNPNHNHSRNEQDHENQMPPRHHRHPHQSNHRGQGTIQHHGTLPPDPNASNITNTNLPHHGTPHPFQFPLDMTPTAPTPLSPSPARLKRFCTECSAVRRANLTLRDWCLSALSRASEVLESWSDEVGVSRGSGDEMDWQPEPVVRVLILNPSPTTAATATPPIGNGSTGANSPTLTGTGSGSAFGWYPGGNGNFATGMGMGTGSSSWGLRPGTLSPASPASESGCGNSGPGLGVLSPGNVSVSYDFGTRSARMVTPPETPPSQMIT
ncbi:hypothetical protein GGR51DRAFT_555915 [Nemania sp. FL0031]|nr:hypothetical protein GGR51DRAFT_555915 [Nemania sp. FL0031]